MKPISRADITDRKDFPSIGRSVAGNLRRIGVRLPQDFAGIVPYTMYDDLCQATGGRQDPCVIDTFIVASKSKSASRRLETVPAQISAIGRVR